MNSCGTRRNPPTSWEKRSAELLPIENYDGQGKSQWQEERDSLKAAGLVFLVTMVIILATFTAIYFGVTMVGQ